MEDLFKWAAEEPSAVVLLLLAVLAFFRGWIVPKGTHEREVQRADRFEQLTLRLLNVTDTSLGLVAARAKQAGGDEAA